MLFCRNNEEGFLKVYRESKFILLSSEREVPQNRCWQKLRRTSDQTKDHCLQSKTQKKKTHLSVHMSCLFGKHLLSALKVEGTSLQKIGALSVYKGCSQIIKKLAFYTVICHVGDIKLRIVFL